MDKPAQSATGPAVNLAELLERVENDHELLQDLIAIFKQDFPRHLCSLKEAVAREEMKQVQSTSHTLKGMLANLAMDRASAAAAHLEGMGRSGVCAGLKDALALFEQEAASLLPELDAYLEEVWG